MNEPALKQRVKAHWEKEVCGSRYGAPSGDLRHFFAEADHARYLQDHMIERFARFDESAGKRVLEIGLGTGADFCRWIKAGADAHGRDLTSASVNLVNQRLALLGLSADVGVGDAENLDFPDASFDIYYSWGVLHHTPNTEAAVAEAYRVLKPGGSLRIMLYHYPSVGNALVWLANGPGKGKFQSPRRIIASNVESPGTKAYTRSEAVKLVTRWFPHDSLRLATYLGAGDLLTHRLSSRYSSKRWRVAQRLYPRWFVERVLGDRFGTILTVQAVK